VLVEGFLLRGGWTNHEDKARAVNDFYENLLGTNLNRDHSINLEELGTVVHNLANLEIPFIEDEVWATVKKLPSDKALGPDGFLQNLLANNKGGHHGSDVGNPEHKV
jgi:hypothetical protein